VLAEVGQRLIREGIARVHRQRLQQSSFFVVIDDAAPELATGQYVTGDFFTVLGVPAVHARTILPPDDRSNASPAIVLSHGYLGGTSRYLPL
jgi:hypothetical protein